MISCENHDYIEIACMHAYDVTLALKNTQTLRGKARDIVLDAARSECLVLCSQSGDTQVLLDDIATITVNTDNPHFNYVSFV